MKMDEDFLRYSALDAACTLEIYNAFWDDLTPNFNKAYDLTIRLFPVLMFMQTKGIKVDHANMEITKQQVLKSAEEKQLELNNLCGRVLNVNSSPDCQRYFYSELGIPAYKGKTGKPTTDDLALQRLVRGTVSRPGLRQAKLVQDIRGLQKLFGTYLSLEFDADSRLRCSYNPRGTKFGRLSSSKTVFGTGTNLQNLPAEFKAFLVPDEGYAFLEADKRQAEWVVVAYLANDANMLTAIEQGKDVHTHTASEMFKVPAELVQYDAKMIGHSTDSDHILDIRLGDQFLSQFVTKQWPRTMSLRQCGKKSNHGLNYAETFKMFALINEIDEVEAKRIIDLYHHTYPGIRVWYESIKKMLQRDRTLTNCFGRQVRFLDAWGDSLFKSAYSMLPQSTVVDSLNTGMVSLYEDTEVSNKLRVDLLAQVHDSVLMQVPLKLLDNPLLFQHLLNKITNYTSPTISYSGHDFKIATDFKIGMNWGEHNGEKNPSGMVELSNINELGKIKEGWHGKGVEKLAG